MPVIAQRLQNLPPYVFATISQKVRKMQLEGTDIIRMDIGSPDVPPAEFVMDALDESARKSGHHGYSGYQGIPRFREAIARYYKNRFGVELNPETEVLPLIGSKEGIVNLSLAYLDKGDLVLVPSIGYPAYENSARLAGADIEYVDMKAEDGFLLDIASIDSAIADKAKLIWCNYPNNPTGAVADEDFYQELVAFCSKHDILLASDNPYCDVTYDKYRASSVLAIEGAKDTSVEFISMSKTFNMAGWRLGAAVGNAQAIKNLLQVKSNVDSGHFIGMYDAGIAALDETTDAWLAERNAMYQERRDIVISALDDIGLSAITPKGSLYIWAKVEDMPAMEYIEQALNHAHVSIAPGAAYGPGGTDYVRISVTIPKEKLYEGLDRLRNWYQNK